LSSGSSAARPTRSRSSSSHLIAHSLKFSEPQPSRPPPRSGVGCVNAHSARVHHTPAPRGWVERPPHQGTRRDHPPAHAPARKGSHVDQARTR
jgi:hypothetical protein